MYPGYFSPIVTFVDMYYFPVTFNRYFISLYFFKLRCKSLELERLIVLTENCLVSSWENQRVGQIYFHIYLHTIYLQDSFRHVLWVFLFYFFFKLFLF